jgi:hypothetical protein
VTNQARERHTGDDALTFPRLLARTYRTGEVHIALDNDSTHETPHVQAWLRRHQRFNVPFHPDLGVVAEPGRGLVRDPHPPGDPARRFENVRVLTAAIERLHSDCNAAAGSFACVKTADEILAKAVRKTQADSGARR